MTKNMKINYYSIMENLVENTPSEMIEEQIKPKTPKPRIPKPKIPKIPKPKIPKIPKTPKPKTPRIPKQITPKPLIQVDQPLENEMLDNVDILKPMSDDQLDIVNNVITNNNVLINAVAGSGKTTTSLHIALKNVSKQILLLTYNAKLKLETRNKVAQLNIGNMEVHSYHSFCVKYFNPKAYTDSGIIQFIKNYKTNPTNFEQLKPFNYDIIIIDEAQDMNFIYYEVVQHIIKGACGDCQLVIMGDQKQSIYQFNNADSRFLTMASSIYNKEWKLGNLITSYRLTDQMAKFINNCCVGTLPINTIKSGPVVRYVICDTFGGTPLRIIMNILSSGYNPDDIFILTPSVKSAKSPIRQLANRLSTKSIPIYVPTSDDEKLDGEILDHKIVFSTYHQVKGLERKIVMVFGFDSSYPKYYATDIQVSQIPNTLYVAITRATSHLILLHDAKHNYLEFINKRSLNQYAKLDILCNFNPKCDNDRSRVNLNRTISVTELTSYVPVEVLNECMTYLSYKQIQNKSHNLDIPSKIKQNNLYESIREIISSSIPYYYEYKVTNHLTIYDYLRKSKINHNTTSKCLLNDDQPEYQPECQNKDQNKHYSIYDKLYDELSDDNSLSGALLELTTHWLCDKSGYSFKKCQIKDYGWASLKLFDGALERIKKIVGSNLRGELEFEKEVSNEYDIYTIHGFIDVYNKFDDELWELKVVNDIDTVHFLQTAIYMWIMNQTNRINYGYLFNIMDDRLYRLDPQNLNQIVEILVNHKKEHNIIKSNSEFVDKCNIIQKSLLNQPSPSKV